MKKIYFLFVFAFMAFATVNAQLNVTFAVDMNNESFDPANDVITLGGDFQSWSPGNEAFDDSDGNGVYTYTYEGVISPGQELLFKFVINTWGTNEFSDGTAPSGDCAVDDGAGNVNRTFSIPSDATGTYMLPIYIYNTCDESTLPVGVKGLSSVSEWSVAPNPANNFTTVNFTTTGNTDHHVTVTSLTGQIVKQFNSVNGSSLEISTLDMAAGMYFVTLSNDLGELATQKLIVQ